MSWEPNRNLSVNVQAAKGFRLGGINDPLNVPLCEPEDLEAFSGQGAYDDETLWNYEAGVKYSKGGITFNSAVFHNEIRDLQVTATAGSCSSRLVFNVPKAHSTGLEAELSAQSNSRSRPVGQCQRPIGQVRLDRHDVRLATSLPESKMAIACRPCRSFRSLR